MADLCIRNPRRFLLASLISFAVLGAFGYAAAFSPTFLSDDFCIVMAVRAGGPSAIWWSGDPDPIYSSCMPPVIFLRPVVSLLFYLDHALYGLDARGYHLTNLALHVLNAFWVLCIALHMAAAPWISQARRRALAYGAGLLFLLSPSHSEAVSWLSGRTDLAATCFALACFVHYLAYRRSGGWPRLLASHLLFAGALNSKESAVALPLAIAAYELFRPLLLRRTSSHRDVMTAFGLVASYIATLGVYLVVRMQLLGVMVGGYGSAVHLYIDVRRIAVNLLSFPARALFPSLPEFWMPLAALAVVAALFALGLAARLRKRTPRVVAYTLAPAVLCGGVFFLLSVPALNLPVSLTKSVGERLLYLPSAFAWLAMMLFAGLCLPGRRSFGAALLAASLLSAAGLMRANHNWAAAAEITRGVQQSLPIADGPRQLDLLMVPDELRGAYVFRNGIRTALQLRPGSNGSEIISVLSQIELDRADDTVAVSHLRGRRYQLVLSNPRALLKPMERAYENAGAAPPPYRVVEMNEHRLEIELRDADHASDVYYYSAGRMHTLLEASDDPE